ncbi:MULTISPECIES: HNH/endonuclease VII fold putative polymorphic toxin, partial [Streptomyces]
WNKSATAYTPLRFPGQYYDPESGLHYNYFRYYDPESARYLTQDPLGLAPADNPCTYVHNPHTRTDPLGLSPCEDPSHDTSKSRREAFRKAKQHLGIPMSQHPDEIQRVPMTDRDGNRILDANNQFVMTREYIFTRADGSRVMIQDHAAGHYYGEGGQGDQGSHFNVRPIENTRTGHVPGTARHYDSDRIRG